MKDICWYHVLARYCVNYFIHSVGGVFMVIDNVIMKIFWRERGVGVKLVEEIEGFGRKRVCYYTG